MMGPQVQISIPTTSLSSDSKPHTIYNIKLRLPLRSFVVPKRYSEFIDLHSSLTEGTGSAPPFHLPQKSWFSRTVSNPALTETRRQELEHYLQGINQSENDCWKKSSAWRAFLNLPSSLDSAYSSSDTQAQKPQGTSSTYDAPVKDPKIWIDCYRELKTYLHDARLYLAKRDQASTTQSQHENSAAAKRQLVRAGGTIVALEEGLKHVSNSSSTSEGMAALGEGEIRRRKDLLRNASQEKDGLDKLAMSMNSASTTRQPSQSAAASQQEKDTLLSDQSSRRGGGGTKGRVLGGNAAETERTRELDNIGVLQLQQQMMEEQDSNLEQLQKIVSRQKAIGVSINIELEEQAAMLKLVEEDVDRVDGKVRVAKKRVGKIS